MNAKQIANLIGITTKTQYRASMAIDAIKDAAFREARYSNGTPLFADYYQLGVTAQTIQHATDTGRIHGAAILAFRDLTPYQMCKLVAKLATTVWTSLDEAERCAVIRQALV